MKYAKTISQIYERLYESFGPQRWWPARTPFEVCVGAILTQNTAWQNVERAIAALRREGVLSPKALGELSKRHLADLIRPAGYFNVKAKRLKSFIEYLLENYRGNLEAFFKKGLYNLREELLTIHGVGRETADSIILYAARKPIFVVDAYTRRIFSRHGFFKADLDYDEIARFFMDNLAPAERIYNEYHALIVALGKNFCKRHPKCEVCPINRKELFLK